MTQSAQTRAARRMSETRAARIFTAHGGVCHICGQKIDGGREAWEVEHVIALEISGDDSDGNLAPAHVGCHRGKTRDDAAAIAKCKRQERRTMGIKRTVKAKIPGSRGTKWKRTFNHGTVRRD